MPKQFVSHKHDLSLSHCMPAYLHTSILLFHHFLTELTDFVGEEAIDGNHSERKAKASQEGETNLTIPETGKEAKR